jgi:hypothetical protein
MRLFGKVDSRVDGLDRGPWLLTPFTFTRNGTWIFMAGTTSMTNVIEATMTLSNQHAAPISVTKSVDNVMRVTI